LGSIEDHSSDSKITQNSNPKSLVSIIWWTSGIHSLFVLPGGMRYNAELFCAFIMPGIERNFCGGKRRKTPRGAHLHLDNAPAHSAKRSREEIASIFRVGNADAIRDLVYNLNQPRIDENSRKRHDERIGKFIGFDL
jgi:hypothetical protein